MLDYETLKNHVKLKNYYPKASPQFLPKMRPSLASSMATNYVVSLFPKKNNYLCVITKETFYKPLKMLYRYKSKWYMPPKIKTKYGLSKANLLQKNFKRINKKNRVKSLKNQINEKKLKGPSFAITANAIPTLIKQKNNFSFKKKYIKTKFTKVKFNIKKKNVL